MVRKIIDAFLIVIVNMLRTLFSQLFIEHGDTDKKSIYLWGFGPTKLAGNIPPDEVNACNLILRPTFDTINLVTKCPYSCKQKDSMEAAVFYINACKRTFKDNLLSILIVNVLCVQEILIQSLHHLLHSVKEF